MKRNRFAVPTALVGAFVCAAAWTAAADDPRPELGLRVESARIDLGDVTSGAEKTGTFIFHNDGAADVRILRAKPS